MLAEKVDVGFTYLSRVENGRLNFGDYPSDALIHRLADALEADEEELTVLAERVPERIRRRVLQRPDVFGALANCDDKTLDKLMTEIGKASQSIAPKVYSIHKVTLHERHFFRQLR